MDLGLSSGRDANTTLYFFYSNLKVDCSGEDFTKYVNDYFRFSAYRALARQGKSCQIIASTSE